MKILGLIKVSRLFARCVCGGGGVGWDEVGWGVGGGCGCFLRVTYLQTASSSCRALCTSSSWSVCHMSRLWILLHSHHCWPHSCCSSICISPQALRVCSSLKTEPKTLNQVFSQKMFDWKSFSCFVFVLLFFPSLHLNLCSNLILNSFVFFSKIVENKNTNHHYFIQLFTNSD